MTTTTTPPFPRTAPQTTKSKKTLPSWSVSLTFLGTWGLTVPLSVPCCPGATVITWRCLCHYPTMSCRKVESVLLSTQYGQTC